MRTTHLFLLGAVAVGTIACDPPTHPKRFAETIFSNVCHLNFDCCTPNERLQTSTVSLGGGALNEDECKEELYDQLGGVFAVIEQAVDDGRAIYDAEAADRCTKDMQEAFDTCDSQKIFGGGDTNSLIYLFDANDAECGRLAVRGYTRGTVKDGDKCSSDVECEDFGECVFGDDVDVDVALVDQGKCRSPAGKGEDCSERDCDLGTVCDGSNVCVEPVVVEPNDGDACNDDFDCTSDNCSAVEGVCSNDGFPCSVDEECFSGDFCFDGACNDTGASCDLDEDCEVATCSAVPGVCEAAAEVKIEICDGQ